MPGHIREYQGVLDQEVSIRLTLWTTALRAIALTALVTVLSPLHAASAATTPCPAGNYTEAGIRTSSTATRPTGTLMASTSSHWPTRSTRSTAIRSTGSSLEVATPHHDHCRTTNDRDDELYRRGSSVADRASAGSPQPQLWHRTHQPGWRGRADHLRIGSARLPIIESSWR